MKNGTGNTMIVAVAAVVIGLIVGYGISSTMKSKTSQGGNAMQKETSVQSAATDTKAADLRVLLNNLETDHVRLAAAATRAGFDGSKTFEAAAGELGKNTDSLSGAIGSVYGDPAGAEFKKIWASHITFFVNYTVAAKKGDKAGMDQAVKDLNAYVDEISTFLSKANPNLPKDVVAQAVGEHVGLLKAAVDAHGAGNYAESYTKETEAANQIGKIADTLAGAIIKQKPELAQ